MGLNAMKKAVQREIWLEKKAKILLQHLERGYQVSLTDLAESMNLEIPTIQLICTHLRKQGVHVVYTVQQGRSTYYQLKEEIE
jgi:tRNA G26 N,N-dimethylase Trm1